MSYSREKLRQPGSRCTLPACHYFKWALASDLTQLNISLCLPPSLPAAPMCDYNLGSWWGCSLARTVGQNCSVRGKWDGRTGWEKVCEGTILTCQSNCLSFLCWPAASAVLHTLLILCLLSPFLGMMVFIDRLHYWPKRSFFRPPLLSCYMSAQKVWNTENREFYRESVECIVWKTI